MPGGLRRHIPYLGYSIWLLAAFFFLYEFFLRTFLGSLVHEISASLSAGPEKLSLLDAAYPLTYGLMQIPAGLLIDRFGVRILLFLAALCCALGVFLFSFSHVFYMAFFARLLMGFGSSFAFICLLVLTLNWLPRRLSGFFFGLAQFLGAMGPMLAGAPLVLLLYHMHRDWRLVLIWIGFFGILLSLLILLFVRNAPKESMHASFSVNRFSELKNKFLKLLKSKQVWFIVIYSGVTYVSLALLGTLWGPTYLETRHISAVHATFIVSFLWFGLAFGCPLLGGLSDYLQRRKALLIVCAILGMLVSAAIIYLPFHREWVFLVLFFLLGISGSGQSLAFNLIAESVDRSIHGAALGFNNAVISFFNMTVILLVGGIIQLSFHGRLVPGKLVFHANNFILGLSIMPLLYFIAIILAVWFIRETFCRQRSD